MSEKQLLKVIKIGGAIIDDAHLFNSLITNSCELSGPCIFVHGGGNRATRMQKQLGIKPQIIAGRRITDEATLEVVTMIYAGLINKTIVARLQAKGMNAVGLTGADGDAIRAHKRTGHAIDYGFVGDIDCVHISFINTLLKSNQVPVFSAITHDGKGQLLNTNADTLAAQIAIEMSHYYKVELYYCFTKNGLLQNEDDDTTLVSQIDRKCYQELKEAGKINAGMIPKLDTAFHALSRGVTHIHIGSVHMLCTTPQIHSILCQ